MNCDGCKRRGMCCEYVTLPLARRLTADEQAWVGLHPHVRIVNGNEVKIAIACKALKRGRCKLYGLDSRPQMCAVWPDEPETQAPDGCVYLTKDSARAEDKE